MKPPFTSLLPKIFCPELIGGERRNYYLLAPARDAEIDYAMFVLPKSRNKHT
jgi:hypothetical protein